MSTDDHRTRTTPIAGALAGLALAGYALPALAAAWPALRGPLGVEDRTASRRGYALTFDDGPHPRGTPAVLELLAAERVRATFFLVGEQVRRNPSLPREIVAAGHEIALHCDRHRNLLRLGPRQVREDIARAAGGDRGRHRVRAAPVPPALRGAQRRRPAPGPRPRLAHAAVEPLGPGLGGARHGRVDRRDGHGRRGRGRGAAAARRRRLLRPRLLAAHRSRRCRP